MMGSRRWTANARQEPAEQIRAFRPGVVAWSLRSVPWDCWCCTWAVRESPDGLLRWWELKFANRWCAHHRGLA